MAGHKFAVGQTVQFSPVVGGEGRGCYIVVRLLPEKGGTAQYRLRSVTDDHERVVRENQLE